MMMAPVSLTNPGDASALAAAALWLQQAMLGTVATIVGTLAVAAIGFLMLAGRMPLRRGLTVVVGCFILFGAPAIVAGILAVAAGDNRAPDIMLPVDDPSQPVPAPPQPTTYDPYAGASVPVR